jgi:FkbM family methyltransferase
MLSPILGLSQFQWLFEGLHLLALQGKNIGLIGKPQESGELNAIRHFLNTTLNDGKLIIFDVGANVGDFSTIILNLLKSREAVIYSFEPSAFTFKKLQDNLKDTGVLLYNFGFGDECKKLKLFYEQEGSGLASVFQRRLDHAGVKINLSEEIEIKTIDAFCLQNGIKYINYLKIDAEGNEFNILKGSERMLNDRTIDFIQFEFGGCNIDSRTFLQDFYYLLHTKYQIYRILKNGLYPIKKYRETEEVFVTTNYLAQRK